MDSYRLAEKEDLAELHRLTKDKRLFRFPTVVARRGEQVIGVMATVPHKTEVFAGVLWIEPSLRVKGRIILKLAQAYENVLIAAKVQWYIMCADPGDPLGDYIEAALGLQPYATIEGYRWYQRRLDKKEAA